MLAGVFEDKCQECEPQQLTHGGQQQIGSRGADLQIGHCPILGVNCTLYLGAEGDIVGAVGCMHMLATTCQSL